MIPPTKPKETGNVGVGLVAFVKGFFGIVRLYLQMLLQSRQALLIGYYSQLLQQAPADVIGKEAEEQVALLREQYRQRLSSPQAKLPEIEAWLVFESRVLRFMRWQGALGLCCSLTLPGSYLVWQLVKLVSDLRDYNAFIIVGSLFVILLVTTGLAIVSTLLWNALQKPFVDWYQRFLTMPGHGESAEQAPKE